MSSANWNRFTQLNFVFPGLSLDLSRMALDNAALDALAPKFDAAFAAMSALEKGAIANPDEGRRVGHYWLRAPQLAPTPEIAAEIRDTLAAVKTFSAK
ncbi:MAG: glucose-6-phosphate isomerase, partial [Opitutaceae bacterium]|nr:glucose-6-phosphate isomerase [Opitutaceae bacterium]